MEKTVKKSLSTLQKWLIILLLLSILTLVYAVLQPLSPSLQAVLPQSLTQKKEPGQHEENLPEPQKLMKGRNHNNAAASYAYDVKDIQAYLTGEKVYEGPDKLVFLTIDDGANHQITPGVLDVLKEHGVHATFFPIGSYITEDKADLYQRQIREGHALALHSFYHDFGLLYPGHVPNTEQILEEAKMAERAFKSLLGLKFKTRVWRYPGGLMSWDGLEETNAVLSQNGYEWLDWNVNVGDGEPEDRRPSNVQEMLNFTIQSPNSFEGTPDNIHVVLMHDTSDKYLTLETLPSIIQYYKDMGYKFGVLY